MFREERPSVSPSPFVPFSLKTEPRSLHMLGECSTTDPHPWQQHYSQYCATPLRGLGFDFFCYNKAGLPSFWSLMFFLINAMGWYIKKLFMILGIRVCIFLILAYNATLISIQMLKTQTSKGHIIIIYLSFYLVSLYLGKENLCMYKSKRRTHKWRDFDLWAHLLKQYNVLH